jgi:type II secretory pathway predicted ATPase ExeA
VNSWKIFPDPVILKIFEYSRGIPKLINSIAENALIRRIRASAEECYRGH